MRRLKANWYNELEKGWARRRTGAFLFLSVLVPLLSALVLLFMRNNIGIVADLGTDLPMLMLGLFTTVLLPLFLFVTAADSFSGEAANRTIKLALMRPIARSDVLASKVLTFPVYIVACLAVVWVVSVLGGWLVGNAPRFGRVAESAVAYAAAIVPMTAVALVAVLIAISFRSSAAALGTMIFVYLCGKLLPFVFPSVSVWSLYTYTDWYALWIGGGVSSGKWFSMFMILAAYCMMAYAGSLMLFERKRW